MNARVSLYDDDDDGGDGDGDHHYYHAKQSEDYYHTYTVSTMYNEISNNNK